jgi:ketosteroid isomerase-like protein
MQTPEVDRSMTTQSDEQAIATFISEMFQAVNSDDVEHAGQGFAPELEVIPPGQEPARGESAHQLMRGMLEGYRLNIISDTLELIVCGDWAVRRYAYDLRMTPRDGGDFIREKGHGIHILQRQGDGSWKIAKDIWN